MKTLNDLKSDLRLASDPVQATLLQRFFKTGPGEYAEGDIFLGIKVPVQRGIIKNYLHLELNDIQELLDGKMHEHRFCGLLILVGKYQKSDEKSKKDIFDFYLANTKNINNWDLVDVTCPRIVGSHLLDRDKKILYRLVESENLWERRIAIVATAMFIRSGMFEDTFLLAKILLPDKHDLIHKAVGWMLREVGKKDELALRSFLDKYYREMPRTMLRYAIERFPEELRLSYLKRN